MKLKAYKVWVDGESREWGREFLGHITGETKDACLKSAIDKFDCECRSIRLFPVGERVKLHGYLSEQGRTRALRSDFNSMCSDEQDAYMGR